MFFVTKAINHAINVDQVNEKQQGGEGAPLFHTKRWLASRWFIIPIQLDATACIHQYYISFWGLTACASGPYEGGPTFCFWEWSHMLV
jgi:hypothetical protein